MKLRLTIAIVVTIFLCSAYWYQSSAAVCPVPITYQVGTIDENFGITESEARARLRDAEAVWEREVGRELFVYDDQARFTVNFVFDDRQATANAESRERQVLDALQEENDALQGTFDAFEAEYESLVARYESRQADYDSLLSEYNTEVRRYNDQGGAPADAFDRLEEQRQELEAELQTLRALAAQLNEMAKELNQLGTRVNRQLEAYNRAVVAYNETYGYHREFTQGDYQSGQINVYKFSNDNELVSVLSHEFGHALGIDHVEEEGSLMYYLLKDTDQPPQLSASDQAVYYAVCGTTETFEQQLRRIIRELLAIL